MADGKVHEKSNHRFDAAGLAAVSRIFAREAALRVAQDGMRWVVACGTAFSAPDLAAFESALNLPAIRGGQAGLVADMDLVADLIYGRAARPAAQVA